MNSTASRFVKCNSPALALFATLMLIPGGASAQDQEANRSDNQARCRTKETTRSTSMGSTHKSKESR